jgi:exodeoxyribonuclease VII large subunit
MADAFDMFFSDDRPQSAPAPKERVYSLLELNNRVKDIVENGMPAAVWVTGEIQDLRIQKALRQHIYFNLVQKEENGDQIIAQIPGIIWDGTRLLFMKRLETDDLSKVLRKDIEVKLLCKVNFYPRTGRVSVVATDIDPVYTLGKLAQNKERLLRQLQKEGLIERNKQVAVPVVPLVVGLITACDSAAYHDFTHELQKSGFRFRVEVFNAHMQGAAVEKDVLSGLRLFHRRSDPPDVVVITRGGGSTADLSFFDSEKIARAVAAAGFPVLAAIGHQINLSVLEIVSNQDFKTPTKVAQYLVGKVEDFIYRTQECRNIITDKALSYLDSRRKDLRLSAMKLSQVTGDFFSSHKQELIENRTIVRRVPAEVLDTLRQRLERSSDALRSETRHRLDMARMMLVRITEQVKLLDPQVILKRGFSITFRNGKPVKSASELAAGDVVETRLHEGSVTSIVDGRQGRIEKSKQTQRPHSDDMQMDLFTGVNESE